MGPRPGEGRTLPIDHLRATLILLVVAHHAALAYVSYAPMPTAETVWNEAPMAWRAFPVVDTVRAPILDLLVAFNDAVLMALLFFLAGLFTWRGLQRKGTTTYLRSRASRLGVPFIVSTAVLAPLAYYPSYLQHGGAPGFNAYVDAWRSLPVWPSGPAWFLWVLLAFSGLAALGHRLAPNFGEALGDRLGPLGERPWTFFGVLVLLSAAVYLPMAQIFDGITWFEWGPFTAQTSRILFYALYFVVGIALGAHGIDRGLFDRDGKLPRQWLVWQGMASLFLVVMIVCVVSVFVQLEKGTLHPALPVAASLAFVLSCAASSLMLLAFFLRFGHWTGRVWKSLGRSAYGIYLVHYVFVSGLQLLVLDFEGPAAMKVAVVFVGATALSWGTTAVLRRLPGFRAVL